MANNSKNAENSKTATKKGILNFFRCALADFLMFLLVFATCLLALSSFLWYPFFAMLYPKNAAMWIYDEYPSCKYDHFGSKMIMYTCKFMFNFINRGWALIFNSFIVPMKIRRWFIKFGNKSLDTYPNKTQVKYFFAMPTKERDSILQKISVDVFNLIWKNADIKVKRDLLSSVKMSPYMIKALTPKEYFLILEYCKQKTLSTQCIEALIKLGKETPSYMDSIVFNVIKKQGIPEDVFRKISLGNSEYSKIVKKAIKEYLDLRAVEPTYSVWEEYCSFNDDICVDAQKRMNEKQYLSYKNSRHKLSKEALIELLKTPSLSFLTTLLNNEWDMLDENDEYYLRLSHWKYKIYKEIEKRKTIKE